MSKDERSLLLYVESCSVDYAGKLEPARMNDADMAILKEWGEAAFPFVTHGRIAAADIKAGKLLWCRLSPEAWELAHEERKARSEHMWGSRKWQTTAEARTQGTEEEIS